MGETDDSVSRELELRKAIEEYYLPKQLVDAIFELGAIPKSTIESPIGIAFIDIADYTYLSKFLSPKENQDVLNGLYTAFNSVLKRHGGYLNKIEGDSLMFHFGGLIDPNVKDLGDEEALRYISRELFYTCVEMQRVCVLFNQANDKFLVETATKETREDLQRAFDIISSLRSNAELHSSLSALFQIRIRIGANIGIVNLGNFGPEGAKHWDVVGTPVIDAKRMESTAPIGGLRISEQFYELLRTSGIVDAYYDRFRREAQAVGGFYRTIKREDLFKFSEVLLKDKKNAQFRTYSVQVDPRLPESIQEQVESLLEKGTQGADTIVQMLQYYRGNPYVIDAIETLFRRTGIVVRKGFILQILQPKKFDGLRRKFEDKPDELDSHIDSQHSLYRLLQKLGRYQDYVKQAPSAEQEAHEFRTYDQELAWERQKLTRTFEHQRKWEVQRTYFQTVIYPLVFRSIRAAVLEYQSRASDLEAV